MIAFSQLTETCPEVVEIHRQSFDTSWNAQSFQELLNKPTTRLFVAREGEVMRALVMVALVMPECEVLTIATAPQARRRGIGRGLLDHVVRAVSHEGASEVHLEVATDNIAAIGLYEAMGFQKAGLRKAYYDRRPAPPVDALVLRLDLTG